MIQLVVFALGGQLYALPLSAVERVVPVVEVTPLPKAPDIVLGVVNVQGRIVPVFNIRQRFRLPERESDLSDQLIIAHTKRRTVALLVESVTGVAELPEQEVVAPEMVLPRLDYVEGVVRLADGMIFIHDLDKFLSLKEEKTLVAALEKT